MKSLKEIQKKIEKENIKFYKVGLEPSVLTNGNNLLSLDNFIEFVRLQKINAVFGCELYDELSDYLITEDIIEKELGRYIAEEMKDIIKNDVEKYNQKICKIDFNMPYSYIIACLYESKYFYIYLENDGNKDVLREPEDKLKEIVIHKEKEILQKKDERKKIVTALKEELKEKILNDKKFLLCTNKQLRFSYIRDLLSNGLDNHFEPLRKFWLSDSIRGICQEPVDFIELVWKELNKH